HYDLHSFPTRRSSDLNEIKRELDLLLRKNNQVHISEFNRKVMDIIVRDPVPFIFERLGDKYFHILIDEFQDTSRLQFANLLPLRSEEHTSELQSRENL